MHEMTVTTKAMYQAATSRNMTVEDAVRLLRQEMKPRRLTEKLEVFAKGRNVRQLLEEGLIRNHPDKKPDSMLRKVRDWYNGNDRAIRKEDAIELCFILQLTVDEANELLAMVAEEGFHWRSPMEIVYSYALRKGMDYPAACALLERVQEQLKAAAGKPGKADAGFTAVVHEEIGSLSDERELAAYLINAADRLGEYHNTAFRLFEEYMALLEEADVGDGLDEAQSMTTRDVVEQYFFRRFIPKAKRGEKNDRSASAIERSISANWPDEVTISRMKNRAADVTRKVMILLFLATDGGGMDDEDDLLYEEDELDFEDSYTRLNDMLTYCGFSRLDPRSPFDWMILYCLCVEDIFELDSQMEAFLGTLFENGDGK